MPFLKYLDIKMKPWEKRLRDLSQLLRSCGQTYFDPDLFRQNTNQFLQTSRTVTFIIQKNKKEIPNFEIWYKSNVLDPWSVDRIMTWAKDARNVIEKEGDLDMHSLLSTSMIFSHDEAHDIIISTSRLDLLKANLDMLVKHARSSLSPGLADGAVMKIERRWVANLLSEHELGMALSYTYSRVHEVCQSLARHLGEDIDKSVPSPSDLNSLQQDFGRCRFIKLNKPGVGQSKNLVIERNEKFRPPPEIVKLIDELHGQPKPASLDQVVEFHAKMAEVTFNIHGNHMAMLAMFDDAWNNICMMSTDFSDQSEKFLFWRNVANRAANLRAYAVVWTSEVWLRDIKNNRHLAIRERPIIGKKLHVVGCDIKDNYKMVAWDIRRATTSAKPKLELADEKSHYGGIDRINFMKPVLASMKSVRR